MHTRLDVPHIFIHNLDFANKLSSLLQYNYYIAILISFITTRYIFVYININIYSKSIFQTSSILYLLEF